MTAFHKTFDASMYQYCITTVTHQKFHGMQLGNTAKVLWNAVRPTE